MDAFLRTVWNDSEYRYEYYIVADVEKRMNTTHERIEIEAPFMKRNVYEYGGYFVTGNLEIFSLPSHLIKIIEYKPISGTGKVRIWNGEKRKYETVPFKVKYTE